MVLTARIVSVPQSVAVPTVVPVVASVAGLRALVGGTSVPTAALSGSAGGLFSWSDTPAIDDGGTVLNSGGVSSNTSGWRRIFSGPLDLGWFGAKGDGVSNDTASVVLAFAALATSSSRTLLVRPGVYLHTGISFPSQVRITGMGARGLNTLSGSARFKYAGFGDAAYTFHNVLSTHVEDIVLDGGGNDGTGADGRGADQVISCQYLTTDCSLERVTICGAKRNNEPTQTGGKLIDFPGTLEIDNFVLRRCSIIQDPENFSHHAKYGVYNFNSNAFNITFEHCIFSGADYLCYFSQGSCNVEHCQMFRFDSRAVWVGTVAQPFTLRDIYTEGTDGTFFEIFPSAGVSQGSTIRLIDCQLNAVCDVKTACTQRLVIENLSTGGNVVVVPVDTTFGNQPVVIHRCSFNSGKGVTGTGALTHVDRFDDSEAGFPVTRIRHLRHPYSSDTTVLDAEAQLGSGAYWIPTLTANRIWTLSGGTVVKTGSGPTVGHTGTQISDRYQFRIEITTGGALGVGAFRWSKNNGSTWDESSVTLAATHTLGTTGVTATFAAGTYVLNDQYSWSSESVSDGEHMFVSRIGCADNFTLKVGNAVTLDRGTSNPTWALLEYDTSQGWTVLARGGQQIVNADVNASAAIDGSKINPNFGSQDIQTTGMARIGTSKAPASGTMFLDGATAANRGARFVGYTDVNQAGIAANYDPATGKNAYGGGSGLWTTNITTGSSAGDWVCYTAPNTSEGTTITLTERFRVIQGGGLQLNAGPKILTGTGSPEGSVTAPTGSLYLNTSGGAATTLYVKESGAGNTGWIGK